MSDFADIFGGGGFDASTIEGANNFAPIPSGDYNVVIDDCTLKDTKSGTGKYLKLVLVIDDGKYQGRKIFENINIINDNTRAQEIGRRMLAQLCLAIGRSKAQDSSELIGGSCSVKVTTVTVPNGPSDTSVKAYKARMTTTNTSAPSASSSAPAVKPWEQQPIDSVVGDSDDLPF